MRKHLLIPFLAIWLLLISCSGQKSVSSGDAVPAVLKGERWIEHLNHDLLPYWMSAEAKGIPQGNFPTFRGMDGRIIEKDNEGNDLTVRFTRMLARQVYVYSMGFMLTGDSSLLQLAKDGCDWLVKYALDKDNGGWYAILDKNGNPLPGKEKYAQDTAYVAQAFAAYFFVTRDSEMEKYLLLTRDLIFNQFWDEENQRVKDGLSPDMATEIDQGNDKGWELVAQLDQVNAYMMLSQPVLTEPSRREQFLQDMKTLIGTMVKHFLRDGIFWGIHNNIGKFDTRHVDFGHTIKSYWMLHQLDKRLPGQPYREIIKKNIHRWLLLAFDKENGTWGEKMLKDEITGELYAQYGSPWWGYAELDQVAATLNLADPKQRYIPILAKTCQHWLDGFVDQQYGEVYFSIKRDGSKGWDWAVDDVMKCFLWKNGFHSVEHAVVMYIHGQSLENKPVSLFFAVPTEEKKQFIAKPYIFEGKEIERTGAGLITIYGKELEKVNVKFQSIF